MDIECFVSQLLIGRLVYLANNCLKNVWPLFFELPISFLVAVGFSF